MGFFGGVLSNTASALGSLAVQSVSGSVASRFGGLVNAANRLASGNILGAVGIYRDITGKDKKGAFGGGTLGMALQQHKEIMGVEWERKNRFYIEILDLNPLESSTMMLPKSIRNEAIRGAQSIQRFLGGLNSLTFGISNAVLTNAMGMLNGAAKFNLYAIGVQYTPVTIEGDEIKIGSGSVDFLTGSGRAEITVTCRDDKYGTIKRWMDGKAAQTTNSDGTFGVPSDYAINIRILHGYIGDELAMGRGYEQSFLCRVGGYDIDKSRADNALNELQLKFVQIDTLRSV